MQSRGVVYCATTNTAYLEAALISAIALREQEPTLPMMVISDQPLLKFLPLDRYDITPRLLKADEMTTGAFSSRAIKTRLNLFTPYQESLFLDADILPLQPIAHLWDYLSQGDLAMVIDRLSVISLCDHIAQEEKLYTLQSLPGNTPQFNSGVMLWRDTPIVHTLFQQWHQEWKKFQKHDQLALVRALRSSQLPVTELPKSYNISPVDAASLVLEKHPVHLLHCWGGMISSGKFRQFAQRFYPDIVETVVQLLGNCYAVS